MTISDGSARSIKELLKCYLRDEWMGERTGTTEKTGKKWLLRKWATG